LARGNSYIGVLIDDLVTKGTDEPYRMFTSRVEHRLLLREENADIRLRELGFNLGLVSYADLKRTKEKKKRILKELTRLKSIRLKPVSKVNNALKELNSAPLKKPTGLDELLKRPELSYENINSFDSGLVFENDLIAEINSEVKYAPFILRQRQEIERFRDLERIRIPSDLDFKNVSGLSLEIREKLERFKPCNLSSASRISGITPASISILSIWLKKLAKEKRGSSKNV